MQIPLPPGYTSLVPFDRDKHRNLGIAAAKRGPFAAGLHGIHILLQEFTHAARHYPIVFVREPASGRFVAVAVTGLDPGKNLFIDAKGEWLDHHYVPAYIRRWPFFTAPLEDKDGTRKSESLVLVDESGLDAGGAPLFGADGKGSDEWTKLDTLMRELEGMRAQHDRFLETLTTHRLLVPFEAHAYPKQGRDLHLTGMHRIDENRLNALEGRELKGMAKRGELSRAYAHLMSLDNFRHLMDRASARANP